MWHCSWLHYISSVAKTGKNLGVVSGWPATTTAHVASICRSKCCQLCQLKTFFPSLSTDACSRFKSPQTGLLQHSAVWHRRWSFKPSAVLTEIASRLMIKKSRHVWPLPHITYMSSAAFVFPFVTVLFSIYKIVNKSAHTSEANLSGFVFLACTSIPTRSMRHNCAPPMLTRPILPKGCSVLQLFRQLNRPQRIWDRVSKCGVFNSYYWRLTSNECAFHVGLIQGQLTLAFLFIWYTPSWSVFFF